MKKFKLINVDNGFYLKEYNPHPKVLIKKGLTQNNPEYDAFERKSEKKSVLITNPKPGKYEYYENELRLEWQLYDHETRKWVNFDKADGMKWHDFKVTHGNTRKVYELIEDIYSSIKEDDKKPNLESHLVKVFISSPYTLGDASLNIRKQMEISNKLMDLGFFPYTPLNIHFQNMVFPRPHKDWLNLERAWLLSSDVVLRTGGESKGSDELVNLAISHGIPVFYDLDSLIENFTKPA
jgi:hypothetical protein